MRELQVQALKGTLGDFEAATTPRPAALKYKLPATHPSDWGAPAVELPEAPRPYGPSPAATADPAFYDVGTSTLTPSRPPGRAPC